jgi:hypothetical protein
MPILFVTALSFGFGGCNARWIDHPGRFQILDKLGTLYLLDTASGETWIRCGSDLSFKWCAMDDVERWWHDERPSAALNNSMVPTVSPSNPGPGSNSADAGQPLADQPVPLILQGSRGRRPTPGPAEGKQKVTRAEAIEEAKRRGLIPPLSEDQVRARAAKLGLNADDSVQSARRMGLIGDDPLTSPPVR